MNRGFDETIGQKFVSSLILSMVIIGNNVSLVDRDSLIVVVSDVVAEEVDVDPFLGWWDDVDIFNLNPSADLVILRNDVTVVAFP